jgi:hypothetical protein
LSYEREFKRDLLFVNGVLPRRGVFSCCFFPSIGEAEEPVVYSVVVDDHNVPDTQGWAFVAFDQFLILFRETLHRSIGEVENLLSEGFEVPVSRGFQRRLEGDCALQIPVPDEVALGSKRVDNLTQEVNEVATREGVERQEGFHWTYNLQHQLPENNNNLYFLFMWFYLTAYTLACTLVVSGGLYL